MNDHIETEWGTTATANSASTMTAEKLRQAMRDLDPFHWRPRVKTPRDPLGLGSLLGMDVMVQEPRPKVAMRQRFNSFGEPVFSEATIARMNAKLLAMFGEADGPVKPGVMFRLWDHALIIHRHDYNMLAVACA